MNGPEHYREAERLLAISDNASTAWQDLWSATVLHEAQVHATLALAAASAPHGEDVEVVAAAWSEVLQ